MYIKLMRKLVNFKINHDSDVDDVWWILGVVIGDGLYMVKGRKYGDEWMRYIHNWWWKWWCWTFGVVLVYVVVLCIVRVVMHYEWHDDDVLMCFYLMIQFLCMHNRTESTKNNVELVLKSPLAYLWKSPMHLLCAPCMQKVGAQLSFPTSVLGKAHIFTPNQVETLTINTNLPHSEFIVQNCGSSRGMQLWSFGRVFIFSLIF